VNLKKRVLRKCIITYNTSPGDTILNTGNTSPEDSPGPWEIFDDCMTGNVEMTCDGICAKYADCSYVGCLELTTNYYSCLEGLGCSECTGEFEQYVDPVEGESEFSYYNGDSLDVKNLRA